MPMNYRCRLLFILFLQNCAALCMPPRSVREACHLLLERPGENMIPQETLSKP